MVLGKSHLKKQTNIQFCVTRGKEQRNWTKIAQDFQSFLVAEGNYVHCKAGEVAVYSITVNHIHRQMEAAEPARAGARGGAASLLGQTLSFRPGS